MIQCQERQEKKTHSRLHDLPQLGATSFHDSLEVGQRLDSLHLDLALTDHLAVCVQRNAS